MLPFTCYPTLVNLLDLLSKKISLKRHLQAEQPEARMKKGFFKMAVFAGETAGARTAAAGFPSYSTHRDARFCLTQLESRATFDAIWLPVVAGA